MVSRRDRNCVIYMTKIKERFYKLKHTSNWLLEIGLLEKVDVTASRDFPFLLIILRSYICTIRSFKNKFEKCSSRNLQLILFVSFFFPPGDCYCYNCAAAGPELWASCCRESLRCCSHLAAACRTCDHPTLYPFCSKHFKKCLVEFNEKKQN